MQHDLDFFYDMRRNSGLLTGPYNGSESKINVTLRFRPDDSNDSSNKFEDSYSIDPSCQQLNVKHPLGIREERNYVYNDLMSPNSTQQEIYDKIGVQLVEKTLAGYNACCFAYGATGGGKTYTIMGEGKGEKRGLLPRVVESIFEHLDPVTKTREVGMTVQFIEIYLDKVRDLGLPFVMKQKYQSLIKKNHAKPGSVDQAEISSCSPNMISEILEAQNLEIHETSSGRVFVEDASVIPITRISEVLDIINLGTQTRATFETAANSHSSRSHTIFTITLVQQRRGSNASSGGVNDAITGSLSLVDLAGSERVSRTGSEKMRFTEAVNINKSLTALGKVILALGEISAHQGQLANSDALHPNGDEINSAHHVPFRDSKLTRLLSNSLDSNACVSIIACANPSIKYFDETSCTLQFAQRCASVSLDPKLNILKADGRAANMYGSNAAFVEAEVQTLKAVLLENKQQVLKKIKKTALSQGGLDYISKGVWDLASSCCSFATVTKGKPNSTAKEGGDREMTLKDELLNMEDELQEFDFEGDNEMHAASFSSEAGEVVQPSSGYLNINQNKHNANNNHNHNGVHQNYSSNISSTSNNLQINSVNSMMNNNQQQQQQQQSGTTAGAYFNGNNQRLNMLMRKLSRDEGLSLIRGVVKNYLKDAIQKEHQRCMRARRRVVELHEYTEKTNVNSAAKMATLKERITKDSAKASEQEAILAEFIDEEKKVRHLQNVQDQERVAEHIKKLNSKDLNALVPSLDGKGNYEHGAVLAKASEAANFFHSLMQERNSICAQFKARCEQIAHGIKAEHDSKANNALEKLIKEANTLNKKQTNFLQKKADIIVKFIKESRAFVKPRNALLAVLEEDLLDWLTYCAELQKLIHDCQTGVYPIAFKAGRRSILIPEAAKPCLKLRSLGSSDAQLDSNARLRELRILENIDEEQSRIRRLISGLGGSPELAEEDLHVSSAADALPNPEDSINDLHIVKQLMSRDFKHGNAVPLPNGQLSRVGSWSHLNNAISPSRTDINGNTRYVSNTTTPLISDTKPNFNGADTVVLGNTDPFSSVNIAQAMGGTGLTASNSKNNLHSFQLPAVKLGRFDNYGSVAADSSAHTTDAVRNLGELLRIVQNNNTSSRIDAANDNQLSASLQPTAVRAQTSNGSDSKNHSQHSPSPAVKNRNFHQILQKGPGVVTTVSDPRLLQASLGGNPAFPLSRDHLKKSHQLQAVECGGVTTLQGGMSGVTPRYILNAGNLKTGKDKFDAMTGKSQMGIFTSLSPPVNGAVNQGNQADIRSSAVAPVLFQQAFEELESFIYPLAQARFKEVESANNQFSQSVSPKVLRGEGVLDDFSFSKHLGFSDDEISSALENIIAQSCPAYTQALLLAAREMVLVRQLKDKKEHETVSNMASNLLKSLVNEESDLSPSPKNSKKSSFENFPSQNYNSSTSPTNSNLKPSPNPRRSILSPKDKKDSKKDTSNTHHPVDIHNHNLFRALQSKIDSEEVSNYMKQLTEYIDSLRHKIKETRVETTNVKQERERIEHDAKNFLVRQASLLGRDALIGDRQINTVKSPLHHPSKSHKSLQHTSSSAAAIATPTKKFEMFADGGTRNNLMHLSGVSTNASGESPDEYARNEKKASALDMHDKRTKMVILSGNKSNLWRHNSLQPQR